MRSHYCGQLDTSLINQKVSLCGWVHRRRDHGGVIFIDLRDRTGLAQIVFDPDRAESFEIADAVRNEYVIRITGKVRNRPEGTINAALPTGEIEILGDEIEILNRATPPPFQLSDEHIHDDIRLRYRYIDLRRNKMQANIRLRARITKAIRDFLDEHDFLEIETPMLTRATPEGARDYLVPSRTQVGKFFALPQSPQLFKQLLMISGMERYYQIARCFRDEDLRADRQPEFTQLDIETSFMDELTIMELMETLISNLFRDVIDVDLALPIPRLTYAEALHRFGTDRPDLRNPLQLVDISDLMCEVEFKVFSAPAAMSDGRVVALKLPSGNALSRKEIDNYTGFVSNYGAKGLAYIKVNDIDAGKDGLQSPILKFLPDHVVVAVIQRTQAVNGDLIFFGADKVKIVNNALSALSAKLAQDRNLLSGQWRPVWITHFPMFEYDQKNQRWETLHHPFTAPCVTDIAVLEADPSSALSRAYDLVLNGIELGGGSIRIHRPEMQKTVLKLLGIDAATAEEQFGFLINALDYGCPPHGGIAFGLDRLVMLMAGASSIRDVIAFPKTQNASCLLTDSPAVASTKQLHELGLNPVMATNMTSKSKISED